MSDGRNATDNPMHAAMAMHVLLQAGQIAAGNSPVARARNSTPSGRSSGSPHLPRPSQDRSQWHMKEADASRAYGGGSAPGLHGIPYQANGTQRRETARSYDYCRSIVNATLLP